MNRPVMPPTTAPIAHMLPAPMPSPMDQIDIFAPVPMARGGVVGGLQDLGKMSGQMVEALNTVVYGGEPGGGGMGGGIAPVSGSMLGGPMSSGGGFGGGQMPPPLPPLAVTFPPPSVYQRDYQTQPMMPPAEVQPMMPTTTPDGRPLSLNDSALLGMPTPSYMPMDPDGDGMDQQGRPMQSALSDEQRAQLQKAMEEKMKGLRSPIANQSGPFGVGSMGSPLARLSGLGSFGSVFGYEDGGAVDPYAMEGKIGQSVGPRMVGGTTNVIDASGGNTGGGSSDSISSMDLYDVAMANPPLPITGTPALISALDASMGMHNQRTDAAVDRMSAIGDALRASTPMAKVKDFASGILGATQMDGPMGGTFGINPVTRDGNLGIMANFSLPFEDGGPVGMFLGGDPQAYGEERGRQDTSETAQERQRVGGTTNVFEGDSTPGGGNDDGDSVNEAIAAAQQAEDKGQFFEDTAASQKPVNIFPGSSMRGEPVESTAATDTEAFFANQNMARDRALDDAVKSILAVDKTEQFDDLLGDVFVDPLVSSQSPIDDFLARNPQPRETDPINPLGQLMAGDVVYNRGKDNERTVSRFADLENRMGIKGARVNKGQGLSALAEPIVSKIATALGGSKATDIFDNVVNQNKQAIIAADTNQIVGYADDGPFGRVYTGRAGYNPFGADGASYTVDPQTGALIVNRQQPNQSDDERASGQTPATPPPATDPADTTPPPVTPPTTGLPPAMPDPMDVIVPSTRVAAPLTIAPPAYSPISPVESVGLPQSFLDLLASFNRPAPKAMQEGGAVLDQAAGNFLEALKVA